MPQARVLQDHIRARLRSEEFFDCGLAERMLAFLDSSSASLPDFTWKDSAEFAHLIDGYRLCEEAGLGDPFAYAEVKLREAQHAGSWSGTALELWISLFLEHRRWRFAGCEPEAGQERLLDALCSMLRSRLMVIA